MAGNELISVPFEEDDHRTAFIFSSGTTPTTTTNHPTTARPSKRRKVANPDPPPPASQQDASAAACPAWPALFGGAESAHAARLRRTLFETAWPVLEERIQGVLREANGATLDEVTGFLGGAAGEETGKLTAGFIITGPNIALQDLLFEQLAERLGAAAQARFVRLRASEAPNLKAALKKIICDATARGTEDDGEVELVQGGRKYLDYDLESLHGCLGQQQKQQQEPPRVVVAFQDSEAFETGLLTDLITLFHSWRGRIHFDLLFGVATSVELFQARLLKSTARLLYGAQFDVVQANSVLESVIKSAVAGTQATLRIGPSLLRTLVDRQRDQVAGIQVFISSLKYAYMCHFYANPLSVLLAGADRLDRGMLQPEHIEAVRTLDSFKAQAEAAVEARQLTHAQSLIEDDEYLAAQILEQGQKRDEYILHLLRALHLLTCSGLTSLSFTELYILALSEGIDISQSTGTLPLEDAARQLSPSDFLALIDRLLAAVRAGSPELGLAGWESDAADDFVHPLTDLRDEVDGLLSRSKTNGAALKSKYSAHSRVVRTTVVAQKVQLSRDSAALTDEDKAFSAAIDALFTILAQSLHSDPLAALFLHETCALDTRAPYRDVFVPRPGATFARALARPHDYLACACCAGTAAAGGIAPSLPATAVLYHLYLEAGALVNVADLWAAFRALVVGEDGDGEEEDGDGERAALVGFYRGLAELRMIGFVKQSKKKADHVAKLKWL